MVLRDVEFLLEPQPYGLMVWMDYIGLLLEEEREGRRFD